MKTVLRALVALVLITSLDGCVATRYVETQLDRLSPEVCLERPTEAWASPRDGKLFVRSTEVKAVSMDLMRWESSLSRELPDQVAAYDAARPGRIERLIPAKDWKAPEGSREIELEHGPNRSLLVEIAGTKRTLMTWSDRTSRPARVAQVLVLPATLAFDLAFYPIEMLVTIVLPRTSP
jgi:hypothetical protein